MVKYLKSNEIDRSLYNKNESELIDPFLNNNEIQWKVCKKCSKYFPVDKIFFKIEKRLPDGYENKCRMCRDGHFLKMEKEGHIPINNIELLNKYNNDTIKIYERYLLHNELPFRNYIGTKYKEILKYLIEDKYKMNDNDITSITRDWIKEHRLYGVLLREFKGRICDMIESIYPNRFKPWQYITVGGTYWNKETKKAALEWFINELIKNGDINNIDEIPLKVNTNTFKKYSLLGLVKNDSIFSIINEVISNKFYEWEFVTRNLWDNKKKRIEAFKQLLNRLNINVNDIPRILSYEYFDINNSGYCRKFQRVINTYYNFDVYDYINECYPNRFKRSEFSHMNYYPTLDNIIVRSEPERIIHHIFMRSNLKYKYGDHDFMFDDYENDKGYIPDWIVIHNGKIIIVEYYGMLDMNHFDIGYNSKYEDKERFYKELCKNDERYIYLDLYRNDIRKSFDGLKDKFKNIGIDLIIE